MTQERQLQYDKVYMKIAEDLSKLSYAIRNKVGCIIVSQNGQIISQGYNGTPTGFNNCCEIPHCSCEWIHGCKTQVKPISEVLDVEYCAHVNYGRPCDCLTLTTKPEVLHAESNAISKCARWMVSTEGSTMYITLSPCFECAKLIIQSGIKRVCYKELYRNTEGIEFLKDNGVLVDQISI